MSIDKLQDKIRKMKNPSVVEIDPDVSLIPKGIVEESENVSQAVLRFGGEMLEHLNNVVPAVRFSYSAFSLLGGEGLAVLQKLLVKAKELDYYTIVDAPICYTEIDAQRTAEVLLSSNSVWPCDGVTICPYIGADTIKPFADKVKESNRDVYVVLRTGNKTAAQLQDLLSGTRLVYTAAADIVSRLGERYYGRRNYSCIAGVGAANAADSLRTLRSKYKNMFLLVDGYDYSNANAKNCSYAFDAMGHGAAVCAGSSVIGAWIDAESDDYDYLKMAVEATERMKKNLLRYVTIL